MTKKQLLKILNDDSLELTVEELENIIEEELQKDESEMDPDLIEYCLYYISKAEADGDKEKKADSAGNDKIAEPPAADKLKKSRFNGKLKKLLIIAATIALLLVTTGIATVATNKKVKNSAISFYENHIQVHFDKQKDESGIPGSAAALAGDSAVLILGEYGVKNRVGDLVADFVGMSACYGLGSEKVVCHV